MVKKKFAREKSGVPFSLKFISVVFGYLGGLLMILIGLGALRLLTHEYSVDALLYGVVYIIIGIFLFVLGFNLMKRKNWARIYMGVVVIIQGLIWLLNRSEEGLFGIGGIMLILWFGVAIFLLFTKTAKEATR